MKSSRIEFTRKYSQWMLLLPVVFIFTSCILPSGDVGLLDRLHKHRYVSIDFNADINSNNDILSFSSLSVDNVPPWGSSQDWPLEWDGTSFSTSFDYDYELFSGERVHSYGTISGKLSADAETIEDLTANVTSLYPDEGDVYKYFISVIGVPYNATYQYDEYSPRFSAEGPSVSNHIYSYSQSWEFIDGNGQTQTLYATTVNYNDPDDVPYLHITFSGD